MYYRTCYWILAGVLLWAAPAPAAKPAAGEVVVPLQDSAAQLRLRPADSGRIHMAKDPLTGEPSWQAKTLQTAIMAAVSQHTAGCRMVRSDAGFGWVATGAIQYSGSESPVALRRVRQDARFRAFMDASTRLAGCLAGLGSEVWQRITTILEQNDAIRLALINLAITDADRREQAFRILARGFVAYSTEDDPHQRTIYVNLVATPQTAARLTRPAPNAIEAISLPEGLAQVQAEIRAGLIPPVGNRLIVVNTTGELALVGYALNLIGVHPDPAAQDKLRSDADKIAVSNATDALMGLAAGDDSAWRNALDEASRSDFQLLGGGYGETEPSVTRFAQIRDLVMASVKDDVGMEALREGRLSSVALKRFSSEDAITVMATYTPPVRKRQPPPPGARANRPAGRAPASEAKPAAPADALPPTSAVLATPPTPPAPGAGSAPLPAAPLTEPVAPSTDKTVSGGSKPTEPR